MKIIRLSKAFTFETAHALYGYDGKCKNIHGHSYKLYVTLKGQPSEKEGDVKLGMVMDFGDLKKIVNKAVVDIFDHAILLNENSPHKSLGDQLLAEGHKVIFTTYQPSCENMILWIVDQLKPLLPSHTELVALKLYETENSYCEWLASDNQSE
ncbi:6-carboxytetrahydropterin synthase [Weeksella virosa]|uniref:6-pyruvoyl trahydropterin synthase family protein n=1 Tax=Weeksella virosa TaxID=1014 RepID=UPI000DF9DE75|nr:6-carboxytetrahydropterin synthase [Weeksella virosa]MDK7373990.1 6-carboxytetrahydropterin synthase [Weeksella virosa]SUP53997.1 6-pyruvoyl tetrahydropterin synthase/QueD family protein [Weeksella virosa]